MEKFSESEIDEKFKTLVKKYIKWDESGRRLENRIDKIGWNSVYDLGGFKAVDKADDVLVKYYNKLVKEGVFNSPIEFISDVENDLHLLALDLSPEYKESCNFKTTNNTFCLNTKVRNY